MRIDCLELLRYGKFADRRLEFAPAVRDFHLVVGPNEAGKSTLRAAIVDLLYGIPRNTAHAFRHAMPDLRLGAVLSHHGTRLALQRVKGNRQTLRDAADRVLADDVLAPMLGSHDRDGFIHMFGLDHQRLLEGGDSILSPASDLGQILFESAAGIASLGAVRATLEAEADALWSRRKSADRAFYVAAAAFEHAGEDLRHSTVRTRDWQLAHAALDDSRQALEEVRQRNRAVRTRSALLDRVRRVAPHLHARDRAEAELAALAQVTELPEDAAATLGRAEQALATAAVELDLLEQRRRAAEHGLAALDVDQTVRAAAAEIIALDEQRVRCSAHAAAIARHEAASAALRQGALAQARTLGWAADDEAAVLARIPPLPARLALQQHGQRHAALAQAAAAAARSLTQKTAEIERAQHALAELGAVGEPLVLQLALTQARALGDVGHARGELQQRVALCKAAVTASRAALGAWPLESAALRAVVAPAADVISSLVAEQLQSDAALRASEQRVRELETEQGAASVDAELYRAGHAPTTREQVEQARRERDASWLQVKSGPGGLAASAAQFEHQLQLADTLADRRHETAEEAGELRLRQERLVRLGHSVQAAHDQLDALQAEGHRRAARWDALAAACALPPMPFQAAAAWLAARTEAIAADDALVAAQAALALLEVESMRAQADLAHALREAGASQHESEGSLAAQILHAQALLHRTAERAGARQSLLRQVDEATAAAAQLQGEFDAARLRLEDWQQRWTGLLAVAGLAADSEPEVVDSCLGVAVQVEEGLEAARRICADQIEPMRLDLAAFAAAAGRLAARLAPPLVAAPPAEVALALASRLETAQRDHREADRLRAESAAALAAAGQAARQRDHAQAELAPLLRAAGVRSVEELPMAIRASDRRRHAANERVLAERAIAEAGDGQTLAQLRAEADAVPPAEAAAERVELAQQELALLAELEQLAARESAARKALEAIGGGDDAAAAEARRQEAVAGMSAAIERYVKVCTALRLLRWSIERYREQRQGPMLAAASRIFARLTLGSFDRLVVDFEREPPDLLCSRPDGTLVQIAGLSEGTRDQLYLALRLAALELQLARGTALPFIADDLFINYDDARARAGLDALGELSRLTQVIFLTHHEHLLPLVREVFGEALDVVRL